MDFLRAAGILYKCKWIILLIVAGVTGGVFWMTRSGGERWSATVVLSAPPTSPTPAPPKQNGEESGEDAPVASAQMPLFTRLLSGREVLEPTLKKLGMAQMPPEVEVGFAQGDGLLYNLTVVDSNPDRAKRLANALADQFIEATHDLYYRQTKKVVSLLEDQTQVMARRIAETRRKLDSYRASHHIVGDPTGLATSRLEAAVQGRDQANEDLALARSTLARRQKEMSRIPATVKQPIEIKSNLDELEGKLAEAEYTLGELTKHYTDLHPDVVTARNQRDDLRQKVAEARASLPTETTRDVRNPDLAPYDETMSTLYGQIEEYSTQIAAYDDTIRRSENEVRKYGDIDPPAAALAQDLADRTEALGHMRARLSSARIAADAADRVPPLMIIDPVDQTWNPATNVSAPRGLKLILLAFLGSLLGSCGLIIAFDAFDRRLKTVKQADAVLPTRVLAAIPAPMGPIRNGTLARAAELQPLSLHSEAYRFLGLHLLTAQGRRVRSLMVMSAKAEQGTTNTVTNLGITLAQAGYRVVIVDADVRNPHLHAVFGLGNDFGFTNLLGRPGPGALEHALRQTEVPGLEVITSGPSSENPWQLFRSSNLLELARQLRERADYVLYDTPSALAFTDALNLTPVVDGAFLCVRAGEAPTGAEQRLIELLEQANVPVLGSVLNDLPATAMESFSNYQRYYPHYGNGVHSNGFDGNGHMPIEPPLVTGGPSDRGTTALARTDQTESDRGSGGPNENPRPGSSDSAS